MNPKAALAIPAMSPALSPDDPDEGVDVGAEVGVLVVCVGLDATEAVGVVVCVGVAEALTAPWQYSLYTDVAEAASKAPSLVYQYVKHPVIALKTEDS